MYPRRLQADVTLSAAERRLYELFRDYLPNAYSVFHGRLLPFGNSTDRSADADIVFLIAHPEWGAFVLGGRSGQIAAEADKGKWYILDRGHRKRPIPHPGEQAKEAARRLCDFLRAESETRLFAWEGWHGVALPDVEVGSDLDPALPRGIVLDQSDLRPGHITRSIERIFLHYNPRGHWVSGSRAILALARKLAPTHFVRSRLAGDFENEEEKVKELTDQQYRVLNEVLEDNPRLLVTGVAGSGKTMLAIEKALRLAEGGQRVLYTCYNFNLAIWLRMVTPKHDNLMIAHFHELCRRLSGHGDYTKKMEKAGVKRSEFYDNVLPNALLEKAQAGEAIRFDAVLVDEGQDFKRTFWPPLLALLRDTRSRFYIFCDDSQRIYTRDSLPFMEPRKHLRKNFRNTRPIGQIVAKYHHSQTEYIAAGPESRNEVTIIDSAKFANDARALESTLEFLHREKVLPEHIVILTPQRERSQWREGMQVGGCTLTWALRGEPHHVCVQTIQSYKGLERSVVILTELSRARHFVGKEDMDLILYVALSRARNLLIVLGSLPEPQRPANVRQGKKQA
jgi:hypothetical protein